MTVVKNIAQIVMSCLLLTGHQNAVAQEVVRLTNPSFEDRPHRGVHQFNSIKDWFDCGLSRFPGETPPDIHPTPDTAWSVTQGPVRGTTYLGMVVRGNDTWESVSQMLNGTLQAGHCYAFSIFLSQSKVYLSGTSWKKDVSELENFTTPVVLRIWGGRSLCGRQELLEESPVVNHSHWQKYSFKLEPDRDYSHITLEAFYKTPVLVPYNGNILVDGASDILEIPCPSNNVEELIVSYERKKEEADRVQQAAVSSPKTTRSSAGSTTSRSTQPEQSRTAESRESSEPQRLRILDELQREKLHEGKTIRIKSLFFKADSSCIEANSFPVLDELFQFLVENPDLIIEIGGHTNTLPSVVYCDSLSTARARAVTEYLVGKGVPPRQLKFKGYGKRKPLIADDRFSPSARQKNQRVEIKILRIEKG